MEIVILQQYAVQVFLLMYCFNVTNALGSATSGGWSNTTTDNERSENVKPDTMTELNDLLKQLRMEMASTTKQLYQDETEKMTKCQRTYGLGYFYDSLADRCRTCKDHCNNSDFCAMQCNAYFVKIETEDENNRLRQEFKETKIICWAAIGFLSLIIVLSVIFNIWWTKTKLKALKTSHDDRFRKYPTALEKFSSNEKDDPASSTSTIAESIQSSENETTKLCSNFSRHQSHQFEGNNNMNV